MTKKNQKPKNKKQKKQKKHTQKKERSGWVEQKRQKTNEEFVS